jgi:hypothetical protein
MLPWFDETMSDQEDDLCLEGIKMENFSCHSFPIMHSKQETIIKTAQEIVKLRDGNMKSC